MFGRWVRLTALAGVLAGLAWCQEEDGPGRGVARLSVINGDVSVRRGDSGDWVAAAINAPLVVQDHVLTGPSSRAEVQFDWANMIRLASNTEIRLAELEYHRYQVQLSRGTVMLRVLRDTDAEIEVNTPSVSVRPTRKGSYRVTVNDDGQSEITARSGEAEIYTPTGVERLRSGRTMLVRGTPSNPEFRTIDAIARDGFDQWSENRDRYLERARSYSYVSRDIYGADDLDYHGRWVWVAPYGWVWTPWGVASWWAPYRHGRWVWIDWYGWTWLSYDPWGWAPFHYGRWFWHGPYGWCWYPGPMHHRHYWRPALVAFFGFHVGGVHVGFGFGRIGWVPLAPYEPFYPWYGRRYYGWYRQPTYIDNSVRIVNNVQIVNVYRNARVVNAVSGVEGDGFARGGRIQSIRVGEGEFQRASLVQGPVPVAPAAESVRFADRQVRVGPNLPRTDSERFFARRPAAPVERVPFEEQRRGMEQIVRRTLGAPEGGASSVRAAGETPRGQTVPGMRTESGNLARGTGEARTPSAEIESGGFRRGADERGWRRIGEPARVETGNPPRSERDPAAAGGWRRIGEPVRTDAGGLIRNEGAEPGQWRRFGETRRETGGAGDERGWRRFGEPMSRGAGGGVRTMPDATGPAGESVPGAQRPERDRENIRRQSEEGWRRFSSPRIESPRMERGETGGDNRTESPRSERWRDMAPRSESRQFESRRGGEPILINPPIVRERAAPRFEGSPRVGGEMRGGGEVRGGGMMRSGEMRGSGEARSGGEARGGGRSGRPR